MPSQKEPTRYLHRLLEIMEAEGVDPVPFIEPLGLTRDLIADPEARISYDKFIVVLENILGTSNIEALALKAGLRTSFVDHGILGYAFLCSANLRNGLRLFSLYQQIQGPLVNIFLRQEGDVAVFASEQASKMLSPATYRFGVESWLAETTHFRDLLGDELEFRQVYLAFEEPLWSSLYRELFDCPITYSSGKNEIHFSADILDRPFKLAERSVAELCSQQCEKILKNLDDQPDIVDDVQRIVLKSPGTVPRLSEVADELHLSPRTLRRRLYHSSTSFREVVSDVRMSLAVQYLADTVLPTAEIAYVLGYSDVTAFHRSFKKVQEMTPAQYRKTVRKSNNRYVNGGN